MTRRVTVSQNKIMLGDEKRSNSHNEITRNTVPLLESLAKIVDSCPGLKES